VQTTKRLRISTEFFMNTETSGQKLYQSVANELARAIREGVYQPGHRLPSERDLAERFGVSRPTIREAMIALDIQGLIEARHGSGIYVTASVPADHQTQELDIGAFELTEARRMFEGETAALAAATITDEEIAELEKILKEIKEENRQQVAGEHADRSFHVAIAKATRNSAIIGVIEQLWDQRYKSPLCKNMLDRARSVGVQPRVDEHERILEALRNRDSKAARKAMRDHLERVITGLLKATELEALERARSEHEAKRDDLSRRFAV
jgi:GntR family transcriptional regulator, hexuronate regulon transcriptional repressor